MATSLVSSHTFARFVTSQLNDTAENSPSTLQSQQHDDTDGTPATTTELTQALSNLDTEIQSIKAQVYKKLLANYNAFSDSFEYSLELKDKIDHLLHQADDMTVQTVNPETGLRQKVMSALVDHHEISYKVQENNAILEGLQHFSRVEDILSDYENYMDAGKILQAGHCIQQAVKTLAQPPNAGVAASKITKSLTEQCTMMTEAIDQMLDELVAGAIHIEHPDDVDIYKFKLTLSYNIKVPPLSLPRSGSGSTPGTIRWHELARALTLLDVAKEKLRSLQKALVKQLLQPLIQFHEQVHLEIENSKDYSTSDRSSISLRTADGQNSVDIFSQVLSVFRYIHESIFLSKFSNSEYNAEEYSSDTEILTYFIGRNIAKEACSLLSKHYLSRVVPVDVDELNKFGSIASAATRFEDELIAMGFLTEADRELRDFVETIDIHYTNCKRDTLLKKGRYIIMNEDFKTIQVRELDEQDELERNEDGWDRVDDPDTNLKDSSISTKSRQIVEMVLKTLNDANSLSEAAAPHLYQATRSLIDLYRALMPVHHARTLFNVPALAILFYNDCMYIARELEKIPSRIEDGIPGMDEIQYDDVIPSLKELAKKWLDVQVQKQREELMLSLDDANAFRDSSVDSNYSSYERSMKQIVLVFRHLGKAWRPTLSPMAFYTVLGKLLDDVALRVIKEVEGFTDISEKESHKLASICGVLFECEDQFDTAGSLVEQIRGGSYNDEEDPIHNFVPSWEKFQLLTDILELSFAEIMTRFRAGQLHMFRERELSNLICALFADTPLRQLYKISTDTKRRVLIKTFKVTYDESDMRLDRFLKYRIDQDKDFPVTRKGTIDKWIHQRRVKLLEPIAELSNGIEKDFSDLRKVGSKEMESEYSITTVSSSGTKTKTGQIWRVRALVEGDLSDNKDTSTSSQLENELPLRDWIVYMDKKIIVINKPEGIAVQGGTGIKVCVDTSLPALKYDYSDNPRIVHRLDKTTSGLLILARTRKSAQELSGRFRDGVIALTNTKEVKSIRKKYVAIVHSRQPIPFSDTDIDNFILRGDMVVTQEKNTQKIVMRQHERSTFDESSTIKTIWSSMTEARVASSAVVDGVRTMNILCGTCIKILA
ncbi:Centromere/kinetochore protein zw10 [Entomortierella beljakovae]|nr:Centromere/kinetochore protein zw10 [Entomortierella beljakovae]